MDSHIGNPSLLRSCGKCAVPALRQRIAGIKFMKLSSLSFVAETCKADRATLAAASQRLLTYSGGVEIEDGTPPPKTKIASKERAISIGITSFPLSKEENLEYVKDLLNAFPDLADVMANEINGR